MNSFQSKTEDPRQQLVIYTVVPPPAGAPQADIEARLESVQELLYDLPVAAINIPEVRPETRNPRVTPFVPKMEPRSFARLIQERVAHRVEVIVDRGIVYTHWANQRKWLRKAWRDYRIRNLVLVGGESSRVRHPGPTVEEAARLIQCSSALGAFFLGGITIPTRHNEPERLIEKTRSGISFFIGQVIYEAERMKKLLRDYQERCRELRMEPKRIFLSFAPISSESDVRFLRWWGAEIPSEIEHFILREKVKIGERSIQVAEQILRELIDFVANEGIFVPLGLNIEHVNQRNWASSRSLGARLLEMYRSAWLGKPTLTGADA